MKKMDTLFGSVGSFVALVLLSHSLPAQADTNVGNPTGNWGLGLIVGEPTGLSVQHQNGSYSSLNFILAYSFNNWVQASGDLVFYFPGGWRSGNQSGSNLSPYLGAGLAVSVITRKVVKDETALAVRVPLGLEYLIPDTAIRVFGELVPTLRLVHSSEFFLQGGVGARIYL